MTTFDLIHEWRRRTATMSAAEQIIKANKFIAAMICHIRNEHVVLELMPKIPDACFDRFQDENQ